MPTCWHRALLQLFSKGRISSASWIKSQLRLLHEDRLAFKYNEIVLAEHRKGKKRLFQLTTNGQFPSPQGIIPHAEIVGTAERSACFSPHQMLFYRPTLEDYVLHMKRGPAITYPKDAAAMMMMMDIGCGSKVLESGTGTGGLTLFLSRAVGREGCVDSYELRSDHLKIARKNVELWKQSWNVNHLQTWPDNMYFFHQNIMNAPPLRKDDYDAVALDLQDLSEALPYVLNVLQIGRPVVAYLPNITQVIATLQYIKQQSFPFKLDKVIEINERSWYVASSKAGNFNHHALQFGSNENRENSYYLARPSYEQSPHTGIKRLLFL